MTLLKKTRSWLVCTECGADYALTALYSGCPSCNENGKQGALEVQYDLAYLQRQIGRDWLKAGRRGIWSYGALLPLNDVENGLSLGEGGTPLVRDAYFERTYSYGQVYLKNEGLNPTWSHKDRLNAVLVSKARELQACGMVTSSTGNHGISCAAYAAIADLPCIVFFPPETSSLYLRLSGFYGAQAFVTAWERRRELLQKLVSEYQWTPSVPFVEGQLSNPYGVEGYKTIAYELIDQLQGVPDCIVAPVSEGNALCGIWKGLHELLTLGIIDRLPRLFGCVPRGANALERSFRNQDTHVMVLEDAYSFATSTSEKTAGLHVMRYLRNSGGGAVSVTDEQIRQAMLKLGHRGYCVESASALPVACLEQLITDGTVTSSERVVCLITSTGIKWPDLLAEQAPPAVRIEGTWDSFVKEVIL